MRENFVTFSSVNAPECTSLKICIALAAVRKASETAQSIFCQSLSLQTVASMSPPDCEAYTTWKNSPNAETRSISRSVIHNTPFYLATMFPPETRF